MSVVTTIQRSLTWGGMGSGLELEAHKEPEAEKLFSEQEHGQSQDLRPGGRRARPRRHGRVPLEFSECIRCNSYSAPVIYVMPVAPFRYAVHCVRVM